MNIVLLSGSPVGSKTRIAMDALQESINKEDDSHEVTLLDLRELDLVFLSLIHI